MVSSLSLYYLNDCQYLYHGLLQENMSRIREEELSGSSHLSQKYLLIFFSFQLPTAQHKEGRLVCLLQLLSLSVLIFFMHCSFSNFAELLEWLGVKQVSFRISSMKMVLLSCKNVNSTEWRTHSPNTQSSRIYPLSICIFL